ncbi:MAG: preprotein translocase subunit SecE [Ignavibacteria bacterium GWB2_35_12]|nr:MAG: preprotein translocase subunit SecE [Ignavibacteria bacterium GWA2_35_8]OGU38289.1 MAG: preprotein translocase subunit SecE [Ignavibacteria bacterium GWB2_35_12]OGU95245.1 MAG: preprotein translocase subunit SecE [Ignavibacteria bacterium RIFOXYA2_FULL_35_10]OGV20773.1 MAG: preprotein translocase subunit SecE [Ignavibacteria bacterium RIFOXYC2_FULL_35_21]
MIGKIKEFANDVVKEMKKVSWPSKEQLKESTIVVIITTIIITLIVLAIDKIMDLLIKGIFA